MAGGAQPFVSDLRYTLERPGRATLDLTPYVAKMSFATLAMGGFGKCDFDLPGEPGRWKREIPYLSMLRVVYQEQLLYEGRVEDIGLKFSGGQLDTSVQCFGLARLLSDVSTRRFWGLRNLTANIKERVTDTGADYATSCGFALVKHTDRYVAPTIGAFDEADPTAIGVWFGNVGAGQAHEGWGRWVVYSAPAGLSLGQINYDGRTDATAGNPVAAIIQDSPTGLAGSWTSRLCEQTGTTLTAKQVTLGGSSYVLLGIMSNQNNSQVITHYADFRNIRLIASGAGTEDESPIGGGGFYGGSILENVVGLVPGLHVGVIEAGSDFVIETLERTIRNTVLSVVEEAAGYYTREWAVWEDGRFDWTEPNRDEANWLLTIADLSSLDVSGSVDGVARTTYVLYTDAVSDLGAEASAVSSHQQNPYVKAGQAKDQLVSAGFPMTGLTSAQLASRISGDSGKWPPITGTLILPALHPVQHAGQGLQPAFLIRAGENIVVQDLPKTDWTSTGRDGETLFHVVSADVDLDTNTVTLALEGQTKRADVLLARLAAATRSVTG